MGAYIDLTGHKYNRLTCIKDVGRRGSQTLWLCKCECGNEHTTTAGHLRTGHTTQCAECTKSIKKVIGQKNEVKERFGIVDCKIYNIYRCMKARCYNKRHKSYSRYGAIGITICKQWKDNFKNFYDWAVNNGFSDNLSIERIDNSKGYSPENCRFATAKEQANNRKSNSVYTYKSETKTQKQWCELINMAESTFHNRILRGWTIERTIEEPVKHKHQKKEVNNYGLDC